MHYEPTRESIKQHEAPQWFKDAKFGIFIHWSLFSVPGWAVKKGEGESMADDDARASMEEQFKNHPYAEWYLNTLRCPGSPTQEYHEKTYGKDFDYFDFYHEFQKESDKMDPEAWAKFFEESGAKYVVLVTKHHDGYCLWPSDYKNPFMPDYQSKRDLVGELTDAVRKHNMKMGLYYSGIFDWTFKHQPMNSPENWADHYVASDEYAEYSENQTRELIDKYHPSVLWNDMGYPAQTDLMDMFAHYYNTCEDGVLNNRWLQISEEGRQDYINQIYKSKESGEGIPFQIDIGDYYTPEYARVLKYDTEKWELCRGVGMSFGYNKNENPANFMKAKDVIYCIIDVTAKNGNLLLNVGPMADGTIQEEQMRPLLETGAWLKVNGEAIYATTCREDKQSDVTTDGKEVRYTKKENALYAIVMDDEAGASVTIEGLEVPAGAKVTILGSDGEAAYEQNDGKLTVSLPENVCKPAYVIKIA